MEQVGKKSGVGCLCEDHQVGLEQQRIHTLQNVQEAVHQSGGTVFTPSMLQNTFAATRGILAVAYELG